MILHPEKVLFTLKVQLIEVVDTQRDEENQVQNQEEIKRPLESEDERQNLGDLSLLPEVVLSIAENDFYIVNNAEDQKVYRNLDLKFSIMDVLNTSTSEVKQLITKLQTTKPKKMNAMMSQPRLHEEPEETAMAALILSKQRSKLIITPLNSSDTATFENELIPCLKRYCSQPYISNKYLFGPLLGEGSFGKVYLAKEILQERATREKEEYMAVKMINKDIIVNCQQSRKNLLSEIMVHWEL